MEHWRIEEEVKRLFWRELYDFQTERAVSVIERLTEAYGEGVLEAVRDIDIDWRGMLRLLMKNTVMMLEKLKDQYGEGVTEVIKEYTAGDALRRGQELSASAGETLDDLLRVFGTGGELVSKSRTEAVLRRPGCLVSEVARELGVENAMYNLHCYGDPYYVKGMNPKLNCRHNKTAMRGDNCCEYVISMKEQGNADRPLAFPKLIE